MRQMDELREKARRKADEERCPQYIVNAPLEGLIVTRWPYGSGDKILETVPED